MMFLIVTSDFRIDHANLFLINQYQGRDNIQNQRLNFGIHNDLDSDIGYFSLSLDKVIKLVEQPKYDRYYF